MAQAHALQISVATTHPHPPGTGADHDAHERRNDQIRNWQRAIVGAAMTAMADRHPPSGPVDVTLMFAFKTNDRARWFSPHSLRPSADRLARLALEALAAAGALGTNDCEVAKLTVGKVWRMRNGLVATIRPHAVANDAYAEVERLADTRLLPVAAE